MACKLVIVSGMAFEATYVRAQGIRSIYGLNPDRIKNEIEHALQAGAAGLLSFGTAAGLSPELAPGTVIIAKKILWKNQVWESDRTWAASLRAVLPDAHFADIAGVDAAIKTTAQKSCLRQETGAAIADMESHHAARIAQRYDVPFAAIRVVLDNAHCTLPDVALAAMRDNGTVHYAKLIGSLMAYPSSLPLLLRLAVNYHAARKALRHTGDLFKGNDFALEPRQHALNMHMMHMDGGAL